MCKNDSDNERVGDCFPTFGEIMKLGESDTDSEMPYLIDPTEIKSTVNDHQEGKEGSRRVNRAAPAPGDTGTTSWANPTEIQEMIARRDSLVEEGWFRAIANHTGSKRRAKENHGQRRTEAPGCVRE